MAKDITINKKQTIALIELLEDMKYRIENEISDFPENSLKKITERINFLKQKINE